MRLINRTAVTILGARPYLDWTKSRDQTFAPTRVAEDPSAGVSVVVPRTKSYGTAILLPEFELEEDLQEWVEENFAWVFEFQLAAWTEDESVWPPNRDLKMFREWFRVDIHSAVIDVPDDDIEGEDI